MTFFDHPVFALSLCRFHGREVNAFLSSLAVNEKVSASTQNQALSALLFCYREVLQDPLTLRMKDVDFGRGQLTIRDPKWKRDRTTMMPRAVTEELHEQFAHARLVHQDDLAAGFGRVWLPNAFAKKNPGAATDWRWQWVFPAPHRWRAPDGQEGRHHMHETNVQRAVQRAAVAADVGHRVTCHTFRHSFATISWSEATTSAPSRSSSATATCRRQ